MDRKKEQNRLLLYLTFAFGMTWLIFFAYIFSGRKWAEGGGIMPMDQLVSLGMLCPALAMLLTRYVTKEGFAVTGEGSMYLGIRFADKKWKYYLLAMLLPWLYRELGNLIVILFSPKAFSINNLSLLGIADNEKILVFIQPLFATVTGTLVSFGALGEEAGWRGYMMPKMINLWGMKKAVIVGGIIWGIWHWPLTYVGHNFGMDYWGYPFTGFAAMCIMCIAMGMILTYVMYKSGSIWPAVILHGVNNAGPDILHCFLDQDKIIGWCANGIVQSLLSMFPMMLIAVCLYWKNSKAVDDEKIQ